MVGVRADGSGVLHRQHPGPGQLSQRHHKVEVLANVPVGEEVPPPSFSGEDEGETPTVHPLVGDSVQEPECALRGVEDVPRRQRGRRLEVTEQRLTFAASFTVPNIGLWWLLAQTSSGKNDLVHVGEVVRSIEVVIIEVGDELAPGQETRQVPLCADCPAPIRKPAVYHGSVMLGPLHQKARWPRSCVDDDELPRLVRLLAEAMVQ
mmetsp:Transcript_15608/g.46785  ORF Transcript_15608/g.46785 Transcript_15608/m.46785 type:complete len:206 (+) Transcript_15608:1278-1895(+)